MPMVMRGESDMNMIGLNDDVTFVLLYCTLLTVRHPPEFIGEPVIMEQERPDQRIWATPETVTDLATHTKERPTVEHA